MVGGDDDDDSGAGGDAPDAPDDEPIPALRRDPIVEHPWLRVTKTHYHLQRPRYSTVVLTVAFIAILILYLAVKP